MSGKKRKRSAWPHATDLSGHAWMDQQHRRHSRSLEQIKQRAGAVEEACSPLSDARAGHDQMDIAVERVTPHRLLQATGVNIHGHFYAFSSQGLSGGSSLCFCSFLVGFPGGIVEQV